MLCEQVVYWDKRYHNIVESESTKFILLIIISYLLRIDDTTTQFIWYSQIWQETSCSFISNKNFQYDQYIIYDVMYIFSITYMYLCMYMYRQTKRNLRSVNKVPTPRADISQMVIMISSKKKSGRKNRKWNLCNWILLFFIVLLLKHPFTNIPVQYWINISVQLW